MTTIVGDDRCSDCERERGEPHAYNCLSQQRPDTREPHIRLALDNKRRQLSEAAHTLLAAILDAELGVDDWYLPITSIVNEVLSDTSWRLRHD